MNKLERLKDRLKKIKGALPTLNGLLFIISRILLVLIFMFIYVIALCREFGFPITIVCCIILVLIHLLYGIKGYLHESALCFFIAGLIATFFEENISNIVLRIIELIK